MIRTQSIITSITKSTTRCQQLNWGILKNNLIMDNVCLIFKEAVKSKILTLPIINY